MIIYKRKAKTDRYQYGHKSSANNKQKYIIDFSQPSDEKQDTLICKAGEYYYTWHPKGQPWQFSKEYPQLPPKEKSEWQEKFDDFSSRVNDCADVEGLEDDADSLKSEIEEYRDELQGRLDNMPYQLQDSSVLNERIQELDALIDQLN